MTFPDKLEVKEPNLCMVRDAKSGCGLFSVSEEYAAEFVKRWNLHVELAKALDDMVAKHDCGSGKCNACNLAAITMNGLGRVKI